MGQVPQEVKAESWHYRVSMREDELTRQDEGVQTYSPLGWGERLSEELENG